MQQLWSTIGIMEESIHVRIWLCVYQPWHFARLLALSWNLVCWYGWSSLFEITMTCTCLRNDRITHVRKEQSCTESGSDLPPYLITAPDTTCENSYQQRQLITLLIFLCWKKTKQTLTQGVEMNSHKKGHVEYHPYCCPRSGYALSVLDISFNKWQINISVVLFQTVPASW